jgi:CelD/BcsL family acetyltransferase involved in cellulose biosynthesis
VDVLKSETTDFGAENTVVTDGLKVLTSLAQIEDAQHIWSDLDRRSKADLVWFQSFEWCFNWMKHHDGNQSPFVLMLVENSKAVAVLPLMKSRNRLGLRMLCMLGEPHTQYGNILTENGKLSPSQVQMFETALAETSQFDALVCNYVPDGSPLAQVLQNARPLKRLDNQSMLIDLKPFESKASYDGSLSKNTVKNLRRRRKHLEGMGTLSFTILRPTDKGFANAVADCIAMKQQWLNATGRLGVGFSQSGHAEFIKSIKYSAKSPDGPLAFVLNLAGKPLAIEIGFQQRGHYYSYIGAFDWDQRQHAPGRLQMHETIGWLIQQGATTMDLLANPTDYKRDIASRSIELGSFAISHTMRSRLYVNVWTAWGKPTLKRAIAATPEAWRARLNQLRGRALVEGEPG